MRNKVPHGVKVFLVVMAVAAALFLLVYWLTPPPAGEPGEYLLCFWNVENLFDDRDDGRHRGQVDRKYDAWFAHDAAARERKLERLSEALVALNGGKGPDILVVAEVESERAAELLRDALNRRLGNAAPPYEHVLMKEVAAGRHIAPAILTRLPVRGDRTQLLDKQLRILEGHVVVNGHDLVIVAAHWTSRLEQERGGRETHGEAGRAKYGDEIYGRFQAMARSNPKVDFLVCGDFNDTPADESVVRHLHAVRDRREVLRAPPDEPLLWDLFAGKDAEAGFGTHYHKGKWTIFDQIAVSPGLLDDEGWTCLPDTTKTVNTLTDDKKGRPWRFGDDNDYDRLEQRGYSDHFPVTVRLKVRGR